MQAKLFSAVAALMAAGALAACGSSSHSSSTPTTPSTSTATAASTASVPIAAGTTSTPGHGKTVVARLAGVKGKPAQLAVVKQFTRVHRGGIRSRFNGLQGLSLPQKLQTLASQVTYLWTAEFRNAGSQLPPANLVLVQDTPVSCGNTQITATSPPEYCPGDGSIDLPLGTTDTTVAPLGDAALLLLVSDLYGYHVENALGAFSKGYSGAQLEEMDACFSGIYFQYADSQHQLQPSDEESVNKLLALEAPAAGTKTVAGAVTATDLAAAFNKGILSNFKFQNCLPPGTV